MLTRLDPATENWIAKRPVLLLISAVQIAVCVGLELQTWPAIGIGGASLIALVVVIWAITQAMRPKAA